MEEEKRSVFEARAASQQTCDTLDRIDRVSERDASCVFGEHRQSAVEMCASRRGSKLQARTNCQYQACVLKYFKGRVGGNVASVAATL
eukprot:2072735-Rhodomonas_salina.2